MSEATITVIVSVVLIVLPLAWAVLMWVRRHSVRSVLRGIGAALVPAGLWVLGLMSLVAGWLRQSVDWVRSTHMDTTRWVGVGGAALGIVIWLGAGYLEPVTRQQAKQRRIENSAGQPKKVSGSTQPSIPTSSTTPTKPADKKSRKGPGNPDKAGFTDEDRELMNLLKDRGID